MTIFISWSKIHEKRFDFFEKSDIIESDKKDGSYRYTRARLSCASVLMTLPTLS